MDVLLIPAHERTAEAVGALRDAAGVYGWDVEADQLADGAMRVRVVPGACTRLPEPRRVLERARSCDSDLVRSVAVSRMPVDGASGA